MRPAGESRHAVAIAAAHEKARVARRGGEPAAVVEKHLERARELEREAPRA